MTYLVKDLLVLCSDLDYKGHVMLTPCACDAPYFAVKPVLYYGPAVVIRVSGWELGREVKSGYSLQEWQNVTLVHLVCQTT